MPIVGDIKNLYSDVEKTRALFPTTKVEAVSDEDGTGLNVILDKMAYVGSASQGEGVAPINADTLGGKPAEDFATQSYVKNEIANAQLGGEGSDIDLSGYATKDELNSHTNNESNPHGVTPQQIGAHPDTWMPTAVDVGAALGGYGLGEVSWKNGKYTKYTNAEDLDNLKVNGFWAYQKSDTPLESNYTQTQFVNGYTIANSSSFVTQRAVTLYTGVWIERQLVTRSDVAAWEPWAYVNPPMALGVEYRTTERFGDKAVYKKNVNGVIQYRLEGETEWKNQNDLTGSAPAGYGLGANSIGVTDLNKCIDNGWYWTSSDGINVPSGMEYAAVLVKRRTANQITQEMTGLLTNRGCKLIRTSNDGGATWNEEWVNPPMMLGVEYRTTERNGGSAVYAKRIAYKLGAINASNAVVNSLVPHGISNFGYLVRTHCAKDSYVLPYLKDDGGFTSIASVDSANITVRAYKATWAEATWFFDLYYVKS